MNGWVSPELLELHPDWQIPELGNGFTGVAPFPGPGQAYRYRVAVPGPGTYRVTVALGGWGAPRLLTAFVGRRHAVVFETPVAGDRPLLVERTEFVGPTVPRGRDVPMACEGVEVTVVGGPWIESVAVVPVTAPVIHLAGDSTVTDQPADVPYDPTNTYCGWGQMLPLFLGPGVAVDNQAHSGLTTETFRNEGHWDLVLRSLAPGDLVLFQFGHNDQKVPHLGPGTGYPDNLRRFVSETRSRGATPVLVTPVSRANWNGPGGTLNDLLQPWAQACRDLARELQLPLVDLHRASVDLLRTRGPKGSLEWFHPGDFTHHNDRGGWAMARLVHAELVGALPDLASWWTPGGPSPMV